jgi:hypothetical protein
MGNDGAAGPVDGEECGIGRPKEILGLSCGCHAQRDRGGHVGTDLRSDRTRRSLRGQYQVQPERAALRGESGKVGKERAMVLGDLLVLVCDDKQPRWRAPGYFPFCKRSVAGPRDVTFTLI